MQLLDLTLGDPAVNIALDEALLETAEAAAEPRETLRLWESPRPMVVVGRGSLVEREVRLDVCRERGVPVIRRSSGGLSIVAGPGCLMYALVLSYELRPALRAIDLAHRLVSETMLTGLSRLAPEIAWQGTSDLTIGGRKFSGNSLRCKRRSFLYHGTLLYDFPLPLIGELLAEPHRAPDYRAGRAHDRFVTNLPTTRAALAEQLADVWGANKIADDWPRSLVEKLVADRFGREDWTLRH